MALDPARSPIQSSLLRVVASAYVLNIAGRIADIGWLLLLFTLLSVREVAVFAFASAAAAFFAMGLDAGLNQTLLREFSAGHLTLRRGLRLAVTIRVALLLVIATLAFLWVKVFGGDGYYIKATVLACMVQLSILVEMFCQQWLKATDRQTSANVLAALEPFLKLGAVAVLSVTGDSVTAVGFFIAQNAYHLLLVGACLWACTWRSSSMQIPASVTSTNESVAVLLRASGWFALIGITTVVQNRLDWLLVANFTDGTTTASYSLVNRAYEVLMMLIGTGAMTLLPVLCRGKATGDRVDTDLNLFRKTVLALGVLAAGLATVALPVLCEQLWGAKYAEAPWLFRALMPVAALSTFIQLMYYEAVAGRAEKRLMLVGVVSTAIQMGVNLALVPLIGAAGAVVGMSILALSNIALYAKQRMALSLPSVQSMWRLGAYAVAMALCWFATPLLPVGLLVQVPVILLSWLSVTALWLFLPNEKAALRIHFDAFWQRSVPAKNGVSP